MLSLVQIKLLRTLGASDSVNPDSQKIVVEYILLVSKVPGDCCLNCGHFAQGTVEKKWWSKEGASHPDRSVQGGIGLRDSAWWRAAWGGVQRRPEEGEREVCVTRGVFLGGGEKEPQVAWGRSEFSRWKNTEASKNSRSRVKNSSCWKQMCSNLWSSVGNIFLLWSSPWPLPWSCCGEGPPF